MYLANSSSALSNACSMTRPDLFQLKAIKVTSQAWSNFVWGIRAACGVVFMASK